MKVQEKHAAALVDYWNNEFSKVAAAHHARRHVKQAVMRAKNSGAGKEIQDRDDLEDDLKSLRRHRDTILQQLVDDPDSLDAEALKSVAEKIERKKTELEKAEAAIKKAEQQMQGWLREVLG
jgi:folylpolyglutamate synthase/dihydropteroate synthase